MARSRAQLPPHVPLVRAGEALERLALLVAQLLGHLDLEPRDQVAAAAALELRRSLAPHAQVAPGLAAGRDGEGDRALERRDLDLRAQRRLGDRHRHVHHQVVAPALVQAARRDVGLDDQVARGAAAQAGLAAPALADLRAGLDPGRDRHLLGAPHLAHAGAVACLAGVVDDRAGAPAGRAGLAHDLEAAEAAPDDAAACGAEVRRGPRLGAAAVAGRAGLGHVDRDLDLRALHRLLERDAHRRLDVLAPAGAGLALGAAAPAAEHAAEDVPEVELAEVERLAAVPRARAAARPGHRLAGVVAPALLRAGQPVVRVGALLEALLGLRVVGVAVGVVLARELAVGLLDLLVARALRDPEDLVQVLAHEASSSPAGGEATTTRAGRTTLSARR